MFESKSSPNSAGRNSTSRTYIPLAEIDVSTARKISEPIDDLMCAQLFADDPQYKPAQAPCGHVDLELLATGQNGYSVRVTGTLRMCAHAQCVRCLEPVRVALDTAVEAVYLPPAMALAGSPDNRDDASTLDQADNAHVQVRLTAPDMDVRYHDGKGVQLLQFVRDEIFLRLPSHPLCSPDCLGLCQQCGHRQNLGSCDCRKPLTGALAQLAQLKCALPR